MSMTRKDYEAIAEILATTSERENIADSLARYFATQNPRFDRARFLAACRVEGR